MKPTLYFSYAILLASLAVCCVTVLTGTVAADDKDAVYKLESDKLPVFS